MSRAFVSLCYATVLTLVCDGASAQQAVSDPKQKDEQIVVRATRDPVDKSYAKMVKGIDTFEKLHQLAPEATLRFKLLPRAPDAQMDGIVLKIVGDTFSNPVELAPDHTFALERNQQAIDESAAVMLNRKENSVTWRTEIRTPGLPSNVRRLGDLRLECHVGFAAGLLSKNMPVINLVGTVTHAVLGDSCSDARSRYIFFADRPLFGVTLRHGTRQEVLSIDEMYVGLSFLHRSKFQLSFCDCQSLVDHAYFLPLGDKSWPDDTLVELDYMEPAPTMEGQP